MAFPIEALAFLGAMVGSLVLLAILFLYLSRQACFKDGCPCLPSGKKSKKNGELGEAFGYDEEGDSSSDSDDEVLMRFQQSFSADNIAALQASFRRDKTPLAEDTPVSKSGSTEGSKEELGSRPSEEVAGTELAEDLERSGFSNVAYESKSSLSGVAGEGEGEELAAFAEMGEEASPTAAAAAASGSGLQGRLFGDKGEIISKCGQLEVKFAYNGKMRRMIVTVLQARALPSKERGGAHNVQVHVVLLPRKRQRAKTKIKQGEAPEFDEEFKFTQIAPHELALLGVRFRLYGAERMRKEKLIGECILKFSSLPINAIQTLWLNLEPRSDLSAGGSPHSSTSDLTRSDSGSSTHSMQHGGNPELLVGMAYNPTTGRLSVEIIKGSHFRNLAMARPPDTYVKISLMSAQGMEVTKSKTSVRRGQPNPKFKETFIFQVAQFQLPDVTLMFSVFNKRSMKRKEMVGWFSMGLNNSSEEELGHWNEMRESKGHQVCRWHLLLSS